MEQIKTLEDFKNEVAQEKVHQSISRPYNYRDFNHYKEKNIGIDVMRLEYEAKDRFHAYQLECKDKENENLKRQIRGLELLNQYTTAECAEKIKEIKEFQKTTRDLKDGYDKLISDKVKEVEHIKNENAEFWNKMHKSSNELNHAKKEIEERDNYIHLANGKILEQSKEIEDLKKRLDSVKEFSDNAMELINEIKRIHNKNR